MEKVVSLLFDIENKANQIIEHANYEKTQLLEEHEKAITDMEKVIADENKAKINALFKQAEEAFEKEKQSLTESSNKHLEELEEYYNKNHVTLVDKIFHNIITIT